MGKMALGYGSEWHLLRMLGRHRQFLNRNVVESIGIGTGIEWLDFGFGENGSDLENKGIAFLTHPAYANILKSWRGFWPQTGQPQNWDAVGWLHGSITPELLLVEAKAHTGELRSSCGAGERSLQVISRAFDAVQQDLGVPANADWLNHYYQEANRVAVLWFLLKHGVPARLITICLCGDSNPAGNNPADASGWHSALQQQAQHLQLPNSHALSDRIHKVFIPVNG